MRRQTLRRGTRGCDVCRGYSPTSPMNVWVVKTSEMLAGDNDNGRLLRSGMIAHMLDAGPRGNVVDVDIRPCQPP